MVVHGLDSAFAQMMIHSPTGVERVTKNHAVVSFGKTWLQDLHINNIRTKDTTARP